MSEAMISRRALLSAPFSGVLRDQGATAPRGLVIFAKKRHPHVRVDHRSVLYFLTSCVTYLSWLTPPRVRAAIKQQG